ncbi:hypothetical protein PAMA_014490 [Pampus argenteus]
MKIQIACLLLVLLCATELTEAKNFEIIEAMEPGDCTREMKRRGLYNNGNKCLYTTTFIVSSEAKVNAVCAGGDGDKEKMLLVYLRFA